MSASPAATISADIPVARAQPAPLVLAADSWEARLVRKARLLHAGRKPCIMLVKTGEGPVTFWRVVPDGLCAE